MALSKERKDVLLDQYKEWLEKSKAVILAEYLGMTMKDMDRLRASMREAGGEFHIIKNTLGKRVFEEAGYEIPEGLFMGSTAMGFAFDSAPDLAKALSDYAKESEFVKIKGGFLADKAISSDAIQALADLPPLPVVRAQLMGTLLAPASQLVRILAEPGRQVAAVFKAYADKEAAPAEA